MDPCFEDGSQKMVVTTSRVCALRVRWTVLCSWLAIGRLAKASDFYDDVCRCEVRRISLIWPPLHQGRRCCNTCVVSEVASN
jgi:hypothetical protein